MTKHTPTPWAVTDSTLIIREPDDDAFVGDEIEHIAEAHTGQVDPELNAANAEFIVMACNAHDELVATLTAMYQMHGTTAKTNSDIRNETNAKARAILAKVKS